MKTIFSNSQMIQRTWYLIDAKNHVLGRFATYVACILRGKHKPEYTPHIDTGDYVIVLNARNILVTGNKYKDKSYYRYTGFVGGIKEVTFEKMIFNRPEKVIELAVRGMLPRGRLGRMIFRKLKVYANDRHLHQSQCPQVLRF
ncbi:50S ribosomal protein L13 [Blochmannia endosymbiont of Colobopsis nipponica]|uniref:50S ribosomal protein L13 n=1 Tax=Blochmannia endosymbiont of Colobopsis nipponica TaxID=2681987 RepID=UPI00178064D1|nr:50S ribosomal protein L13 [Blochmannia endosymbiont of Colobopsis nipponica]QOI10798.1 50S ribosomal protein L13 [Blochmannia endosymbiont of Colobopsis nipponica]